LNLCKKNIGASFAALDAAVVLFGALDGRKHGEEVD
jgi:hypothetical protein